jgi:SAM-dependent methyltransferase
MELIKQFIRTSKRRRKHAERRAIPAVAAAVELDWESAGGLERRVYPSYELYAEHQKAKLSKRNLVNYDPQLVAALEARIAALGLKPASAVLCLGARSGAECKAFINLGHFAIGIDLNPGEENRHVMVGDFHHLQFADASVDVVYTNALDHAFELGRVFAEVRRVLKPEGRFITDIVDPVGRSGPGDFEASWWTSIDAVAAEIGKAGFSLAARRDIDFPWRGAEVVFTRAAAPTEA